ncbi:MAG: hypothetical protein K8R53_07310 [Bacteroidales bacterium]|nr:hypothetical protein [Bacteroidales bacterium]
MNKLKTTLLLYMLILSLFTKGQNIEISLTGVYEGQYIPLDSIYIQNLSQTGDTVLYPPDTVLIFLTSTVPEEGTSAPTNSTYLKSYPNPCSGYCNIELFLPSQEKINLTIFDPEGRIHSEFTQIFDAGIHRFLFSPGKESFYIAVLRSDKDLKISKIVHLPSPDNKKCNLIYVENSILQGQFKHYFLKGDFPFTPGDTLRFIGYATPTLSFAGSDILDKVPLGIETYIFDISKGIPCPGIPYIEHEGQVYSTIQAGEQCWLRENMNHETGNSWCYGNSAVNCMIYGRLYDWQTATLVCPEGWHLPDDDEWRLLEGTVDSQFPVGSPEWGQTGLRGFDVGLKLKSLDGWYLGGNGTDEYGFSGLPGGYYFDGNFYVLTQGGLFWSASENSIQDAWYRRLDFNSDGSYRDIAGKQSGFSVKCVKDPVVLPLYASFSADTCLGAAPFNVTYTDHSCGEIINWYWAFEGGIPESFIGQNPPAITYQNAGIYSVTLTVSDGTNFETITKEEYITVTGPCAGTPTVEWHGQVYNTAMIGGRCWLKENMNYETEGSCCYQNNPNNCLIYGRLYMWENALGVCPTGWHLPSHKEWIVLEGTVDSHYPVDDPEWNQWGYYRGFDAGLHLKSANLWGPFCGGTDLYGFSALPGGRGQDNTNFISLGLNGHFWTSTWISDITFVYRKLNYERDEVKLGYGLKQDNRSVRCIKDETEPGGPCPGIPVITWQGQDYNTVMIGGQCWLRENMNAGTMIQGYEEMEDNGIIEKYCYNNNEAHCDEYGGLYQFNEMRQYAAIQGIQGICPEGWHLPAYDDLTVLIEYLDGDTLAGGKMKEAGLEHWLAPNTNATNSCGFTALPAGYRHDNGTFKKIKSETYCWTSSAGSLSMGSDTGLGFDHGTAIRGYHLKSWGLSVRCLKD